MAQAQLAQASFLGGEWSKFAQGRFDRPDYRTAMALCQNGHPVEIGAWTRRPGTANAGTTRGGKPGRVLKFDFEASQPYTLEITDGHMRFRKGRALATTNDGVTVDAIQLQAIPGPNQPNILLLHEARSWPNGTEVYLDGLGQFYPTLQNRVFSIVAQDTTHFFISDSVTGDEIRGLSALLLSGVTLHRVQDVVAPWTGGNWSAVRSVQAETTAILLSSISPQALTVASLPTASADAIFALAPAVFNDGPYLDPFTNGVQANPSALKGVVTLTLSFPAYDASVAYPAGAFVTSSSINYVSLVDQNVGNTPASSPSKWQATPASAAISANGFQPTDVGRHVRLFSEPQLWASGTTYASGAVVAYNTTPGATTGTTYWTSLVGSNTGHIPGTDTTNWALTPANAAIWTWGRITGLTGMISPTLAGAVHIGNLTGGGGLAAAFDGTPSKASAACASLAPGSQFTINGYVGQNYSGASAQQIGFATLYPSTDFGFGNGGAFVATPPSSVVVNLRGKSTAPTLPADGTLLGTSGSIANTSSPVTVTSSDQSTSWNYVWFEVIVTWTGSLTNTVYVGQAQFFNPPGSGVGNGVTVEILGAPLLYTTPIRTWRLGVYSDTTGYPTCGCYHEGRLWLGGAVKNRFDASVANGIVGGTVNFAPTNPDGSVPASAGISYVLNSDSVNPILWMKPDLQGVLMGTQHSTWLALAPTQGAIAPNNIKAVPATNNGSANIEPARTEHTLVYVQRFARKLLEGFADVYSGKFSAPNLADKAQHLTRAGIAELAYQQATTPIIWGRDNAGALFGITYKRDTLTTSQGPTFAGWHRHPLGSGRVVESLCVGPSVGGDLDSLTMVTNDPATNVRHVEVMTDLPDEDADLSENWLVDDGVSPSSIASNSTPVDGAPYGGLTLNGLWHLNGKTVTVMAGGLDCGDVAVANGSVFVSYGDGVNAGTGDGLFTADFVAGLTLGEFNVGFTFTSKGQIVRAMAPQESGSRTGPALGNIGRGHFAALLLQNTQGGTRGRQNGGLQVGTDFSRLRNVLFKDSDTVQGPLTSFSGVHRVQGTDDDYTPDGMLCWQVTRPKPANIMAVAVARQTQEN